jgi:PAS domain-containing protein
MALSRRPSIRLWQTGLFIVVIVVAILILSGSLSAGLKVTLTEIGKGDELRNASALAGRLEPEFPVTVESLDRVRDVLAEYRRIYGGGIWVYDRDGTLLEASYDVGPSEESLERARIGGLSENPPYADMELRPDGWVIAARSLHGPEGTREGVVVTASSVAESLGILDAVRDRLWVTFWASLGIAGLLGFGFSELIGRRSRAMSEAAAAIAAGDFEQRLPTGIVPDEIYDLAVSYNSMAVTLGEAFGAIQESQRQIAAVVESMAEGVVAFDSDGVVHVVNPEAGRLLALGGSNLVAAPAEELTSEPELLDVIRKGLDGDSATKTVTIGQFTVLLHCTPVLDL